MFNILLILFVVGFTHVYSQEDPVVTIAQGDVRGIVNTTVSGRPYYNFRGIPYGQPPLGDLRFQAPLPAGGWDETLNATKDAPPCIQEDVGQEDCLNLNVYTPKLPDGETTLPTIVFIHGGAFYSGSPFSLVYGPQLLLEKDVILVTIAYRLGVFGFLSTGDAAASGNYGLLDQNLALKWVRDNIAAFGGDASRVIIFGQSAGAASVAYQILSPVSAGLFRGAIHDSGNAFVPWALQIDPLPVAIALGMEFACPSNETTSLVNCLKAQTAEDIVVQSQKIGEYNTMIAPFMPVIEDPEYGQFITEQPMDILLSGNYNKVPSMTGCNKDEGDLPYGYTKEYFNPTDEYFYNETLPALLYVLTNYRTNLVNISYAIKEEYFDKIDVTNSSQVARASIDMLSDGGFKSPNDLWVRHMADNGLPVYMYIFEYAGISSSHNYSGEPEVSHAEELFYIFSQGYELKGDDLTVSNAFIDMWTNFAINLDPNPLPGDATWNPNEIGSIKYLQFNVEQTMIDGYRTEQMDFWNNVVPEIANG